MRKQFNPYLLLLLIAGSTINSSYAQLCTGEEIIGDTIDLCEDLFSSDEVLNLMITFDVRNYRKTRQEENYHPAELTWVLNDSMYKSYDVRIKTRGVFRKNFCHLPPFWLNIKHSGMEFPDGEEFNRMKVVTHCNKTKVYDEYVLREYLTYKLYNQISPISFQVRLVKMTYINTAKNNQSTTRWAFLIEPNSHLENRLNAELMENDGLSMRNMNARAMDQLAHFQYMIGNADYSISGRHNIKIVELHKDKLGGKIPIPYDFDFTGIVNTIYASPGEHLETSDIKDRYFLGPCRSPEMHQLAIDNLIDQKHDLEELIESFEYLSLEKKIEMLKYLESYYSLVSKESFIKRNIDPSCR